MTPMASLGAHTNEITILTLVSPLSSQTSFSASASITKQSTKSGEEQPRRAAVADHQVLLLGLVELTDADGTVYWNNVSSMPFGSPALDDVLAGLRFAQQQDYPARGAA